MSTFIQPNDVTSPRVNWSLITVLDAGSEGNCALALGRWDNNPCLGIRWNGTGDRPVGSPQSRGIPTWFVLPEGAITEAIIGTLPADKRKLVESIMGAA